MKLFSFSFLGALVLSAGTASAAQVYFDDFEGTTEMAGFGAIEGVQGYEGVGGISGNFFRNTDTGGAALLTLVGLGAHTSLTLEFDLALIDSWDSSDDVFCCDGDQVGPDFFNLVVDGTEVFQTSNFGPGINNENQTSGIRGFNPEFQDDAMTASLTIAHQTGKAEISFFADGNGYQGGFDESWAIDNLSVSTAGSPGDGEGPSVVPLPATLPLILGAFGLAGLGLRRGRS